MAKHGDRESERLIAFRRRPTRVRRIDRLASAAEVLENPFDDCWLLDTGDHAQPAAAAPADLDVDREYPLQPLRPRQRPLSVVGRSLSTLVGLVGSSALSSAGPGPRSGLAGANTP